MIDFKPSVFSLVRLTFGDTLRIFRAMPDLAITAFLVSIGHSLVRTIVIESELKTGRELIAAVLGLGFVFFADPVSDCGATLHCPG